MDFLIYELFQNKVSPSGSGKVARSQVPEDIASLIEDYLQQNPRPPTAEDDVNTDGDCDPDLGQDCGIQPNLQIGKNIWAFYIVDGIFCRHLGLWWPSRLLHRPSIISD